MSTIRVTCDQCGARYKIPESKLQKDVNKATCRRCGHRMLIQRPGSSALTEADSDPVSQSDAPTKLASMAELEQKARELAAKESAAQPSEATPEAPVETQPPEAPVEEPSPAPVKAQPTSESKGKKETRPQPKAKAP
ncbi:MAG: zinc-ribbon domain-containing protein, partial [Myxococcota bacterium]|nr:zinc-ribbon domain-containing protein [Myxococcota bacterium]